MMLTTRFLVGLTALILVLAPLTSPAQRGRTDRPKGDDLREKITNLRKVKLLEILELEGTQVESFFAVFSKFEKRHHDSRAALDDAARALDRAADSGADDTELQRLSAELRKKIKSMEDVVEERFDATQKVLTTKQYAKYLVFESRFRDELQQMMLQRVRKQRER